MQHSKCHAASRLRAALLVTSMAAISLSVAPPALAAVNLSGTVACLGGKSVSGVHVESAGTIQGGNIYGANISRRAAAAWVADYSVTLYPNTSPPTRDNVRLRVGCGTTSNGSWWSTNTTSQYTANDGGKISVLCREAAGSGSNRCRTWGKIALVGMPFAGYWGRYGDADNSGHPSGHRGSGHWRVDAYGVSKPVRIKVQAPLGVSLTRTISNVATTCGTAGKNVTLTIKWNGSALGTVSFGHLVDPAAASSSSKPDNTQVGKTASWEPPWGTRRQARCWEVTSSNGLHTHVTFTNQSGHACYARWRPNNQISGDTKLAEGVWLGSLGETGASGVQQACAQSPSA